MYLSKVFEDNLRAYQNGATEIVNQGGTRSSKTYSIMQLIYLIALWSKKPLVISVTSRHLPHLKLGAMRDFEDILTREGVVVGRVKNVSESFFRIGVSTIEFFGVDNLGKVHGPARDILVVNEANYISEKIYDQLVIRTRGTVFADFNPTSRFYLHDRVAAGSPGMVLIKSTYLDNLENLTPEQVARIEAKQSNPEWWKVYGLGELGRLEGAILSNWRFGRFEKDYPTAWGMDFGVKDPDALVRVSMDWKGKRLFVREELYGSNNSTSDMVKGVKATGVGSGLIVCDSASLRSIKDLRLSGLNAVSVKKPGVLQSVKSIMDFEIIVDEGSHNLEAELNTWVWLDKKGDVWLDANNHLIDAMRYAFWYLYKQFTGGTSAGALR